MGSLTAQHVLNWRNRSWSLTAQLDVPDHDADGVLFTIGGHVGGMAFYVKDGAPTFCYNYFGIDHTYMRGGEPVPPGEHQVQVAFAYDGGGLGKGGTVTLYVDGQEAASGRVERTQPIGFGGEYSDVGRDRLSTVTDEYRAGENAFGGGIKWMALSSGEDSHEHLIDPNTVFHIAMARQ
jgi:arylsulfatase